jgi:hypothetical protein
MPSGDDDAAAGPVGPSGLGRRRHPGHHGPPRTPTAPALAAAHRPSGWYGRDAARPADRGQDALARLDARAAAAPEPLRAGLRARLAFREAAGWLAASGAWVHPLDLALRADHLTGRFDTVGQLGRAAQALPNTLAAGGPAGWAQTADWAALAAGEQAVTRAPAIWTRQHGNSGRGLSCSSASWASQTMQARAGHRRVVASAGFPQPRSRRPPVKPDSPRA